MWEAIISAVVSLAQVGAKAVSDKKSGDSARDNAISQAEEQARVREERREVAKGFGEQQQNLADRKFGLSDRKLEENQRTTLLGEKQTGEDVQQLVNSGLSNRGVLGREANRDVKEMQRARLR